MKGKKKTMLERGERLRLAAALLVAVVLCTGGRGCEAALDSASASALATSGEEEAPVTAALTKFLRRTPSDAGDKSPPPAAAAAAAAAEEDSAFWKRFLQEGGGSLASVRPTLSPAPSPVPSSVPSVHTFAPTVSILPTIAEPEPLYLRVSFEFSNLCGTFAELKEPMESAILEFFGDQISYGGIRFVMESFVMTEYSQDMTPECMGSLRRRELGRGEGAKGPHEPFPLSGPTPKEEGVPIPDLVSGKGGAVPVHRRLSSGGSGLGRAGCTGNCNGRELVEEVSLQFNSAGLLEIFQARVDPAVTSTTITSFEDLDCAAGQPERDPDCDFFSQIPSPVPTKPISFSEDPVGMSFSESPFGMSFSEAPFGMSSSESPIGMSFSEAPFWDEDDGLN